MIIILLIVIAFILWKIYSKEEGTVSKATTASPSSTKRGSYSPSLSSRKREDLSHLQLLVSLAMSDGALDKSELKFISHIAVQRGIPKDQFLAIFRDPTIISYVKPSSDASRLINLYEMVMLMMIDGDIDKNEIRVCVATARALGFKAEVVSLLVEVLIKQIAEGIAKEIILRDLEKRMRA